MPVTRSGQVGRPNESQRDTIPPKPTPDNPEVAPMSPAPSSTEDASPNHPDDHTVKSSEDPFEDDDFMPSTKEVAETLAGMRSRHDQADRGHEVCCARLGIITMGGPGY